MPDIPTGYLAVRVLASGVSLTPEEPIPVLLVPEDPEHPGCVRVDHLLAHLRGHARAKGEIR